MIYFFSMIAPYWSKCDNQNGRREEHDFFFTFTSIFNCFKMGKK